MHLKNIPVQMFGWIFSLMFIILVAMNYTPFIYADNGLIFGFFKLESEANILHAISAVWAGVAAWFSRGAVLFYFRVFGTAYFLDGLIGIIFGKAYLNLNIFNAHTEPIGDMFTRLVLNAPHIVIGGTAIFIGFYLYKKLRS